MPARCATSCEPEARCTALCRPGIVGVVNVPDDLRYTSDHEWARLDGARARVGITDYAQDALGDIVFVQLPTPGAVVTAGQPMCELESTKSVSDVYAPVDGTVVEVNQDLADAPQKVNEDPYGEGWICVIEASSPGSYQTMMGADQYQALIEG
jgi:glycine cleavage system H protein